MKGDVMNKYRILYSALSQKCLIYGFFAVICNLSAILFSVKCDDAPAYILAHRFAPFLEYPIMSITILIAGAMIMDRFCYAEKS